MKNTNYFIDSTVQGYKDFLAKAIPEQKYRDSFEKSLDYFSEVSKLTYSYVNNTILDLTKINK